MARAAIALLGLAFLATASWGQGTRVFTIDTVAGGTVYDLRPATSTPLSSPEGIWVDRQGALWIADTGNQVIRKLDPGSDILRVVVGGGTLLEDSLPVPALSAQLDRPSHIVGDAAGNIYFSDIGTHRVRRLTGRSPP